MGREILADAVGEAIKKNGLKKSVRRVSWRQIPEHAVHHRRRFLVALRWKIEEAVSHGPAGWGVVLQEPGLELFIGVYRVVGHSAEQVAYGRKYSRRKLRNNMVELCLTAGDAGAAKFRLCLGEPDVWLLDPKFTKDYRNVRPSLKVWARRNRWHVTVGDQARPRNWRV